MARKKTEYEQGHFDASRDIRSEIAREKRRDVEEIRQRYDDKTKRLKEKFANANKALNKKFDLICSQVVEESTKPCEGWVISCGQVDGMLSAIRHAKALWSGSSDDFEWWASDANIETIKQQIRPGMLKLLS